MLELSEIASTINADIDSAGTLVLPGDAFASSTMAAAFNTYLTDDSLIVDAARVQPSNTAVTVTGTGGGRFSALAVTAIFTPLASGDIAVVVSGLAPADWVLSKAFPSLVGSSYDSVPFAANSELLLRTVPENGLPAGLSLNGQLLVAGVLAGVTKFLAASLPVPVSGAIGVSNQTPAFTMTTAVAQGLTVGTLTALDFNLELVSAPFVYYPTDGVTVSTTPSYSQDAYLALSTTVSFETKAGKTAATLTMRFGAGVMASLMVDVAGSPGVLLEAFTDWANSSLALGLPDPALFDPSNYLTLDTLAFFILPSTAEMSSFHLDVSTNQAWTIIPDVITITQVSLSLISSNPVQSPAVSGSLAGTVALGANGDVAQIVLSGTTPDYAFSGILQEGTTVNVGKLVEYLIPGAIGIPDIELTSFEFFCQSGNQPFYSLSAQFSLDWELDVSPTTLMVTGAGVDVAYGSSTTGGGSVVSTTTGQIIGTIVFDNNLSFDISYSIPGQVQIIGRFDKITLLASIARLVNMQMPLPSGFDLEFTDCLAVICYGSTGQSSTLEFQISAIASGLGALAFDALKVGSQWGYAAGLSMESVSLAAVPGLSALAPFDTFFNFKKVVLVVSTANLSNFVFPDASVVNRGQTGDTTKVTLPAGQGVVAGMNAYADIDLTSQQDLSLLMKFLKLSAELSVTLQVGLNSVADGSALYATMNGQVNSNIDLKGSFGARLVGGILELYLTGTVATTLQGQPLIFDVTLAFEENGAFLSGDYQGTIDFILVKLSDLILEIGIDFEGVPTIGFGGQIDENQFESSVMMLLDSINPAQSMLIASIGDINLGTFLQTLCNVANVKGVPASVMQALNATGLSGTRTFTIADAGDAVAGSLNARDVPAVSEAFATAGISLPSDPHDVIISVATSGALWYVTDLHAVLHYKLVKSGTGQNVTGTLEPQLYIVPQATQLGTTLVAQGYRANGTLNLFGFTAAVTVAIANQQGLTIDVVFSKIIIAVNGYPVFSFTSADGSTGPALSVCSFANVANPDVLKQQPHFFANGSVNVLGVVADSVIMNFSEKGGDFSVTASVAGIAIFSMAGSYSDKFSFSLSGSATVGIDQVLDFGTLGTVDVKADVGAVAMCVGICLARSPIG
jgi:hypothetical protein